MRLCILTGLLVLTYFSHAQDHPAITETEVSRIEKTLASDDMQGRKVYTPGIEKAALFILNEFREAGLKPLPGSGDLNQFFSILEPESTDVTASLDGVIFGKKDIIAFTGDSSLNITDQDNYSKVFVRKGGNLSELFFKYLDEDKNVLILVDTSFAVKFARLSKIHISQFSGSGNRVFLLTASNPVKYSIQIKQKIRKQVLRNIAGIIPGRSKPDEYVIFSAHYDHLGIGKPDAMGDSIYNGANDNASGTTAVLVLAKYFSKLQYNERTLIFVTFTAEEIGEFGSAYFSHKLDPDRVIAMLNIEMIGTESKWGKNSVYMTGFDKSDLGPLLQKNLKNNNFKYYPDPYPDQLLFLRSDNATLAKRGVPAHTISTSKMDSEKYYHTPGDGVETLDLENMTEIIRAIGLSAGSVISGKDTPTRVKPD